MLFFTPPPFKILLAILQAWTIIHENSGLRGVSSAFGVLLFLALLFYIEIDGARLL